MRDDLDWMDDDDEVIHHAPADEYEIRRQVRKEKKFRKHLISYAVINVFLVAINLLTSPEYLWAIWPILGWGVGLIMNAVSVYGIGGLSGHAWEERRVREYRMRTDAGMNPDEVRRLLREELRDGPKGPSVDVKRLQQRIEQLEAIVTSDEWEQVERSRAARVEPFPDVADPSHERLPGQTRDQ